VDTHRRRQRGTGGRASWIFMHGTNIVHRGLILLFFGLFCYFSVIDFRWHPPWKFFCRRPCGHTYPGKATWGARRHTWWNKYIHEDLFSFWKSHLRPEKQVRKWACAAGCLCDTLRIFTICNAL